MKRTESNSSLSTFRACPRKYKYKYIDLLKTDKPERECLSLGHYGHACLEAWYKGFVDGHLHFSNTTSNDEMVDIKIGALVDNYTNIHKDDRWKILDVEKEFNVQFKNPDTGRASTNAEAVGKIDLIIESEGTQWVVDHKFNSSFKPREYWMVNSQMDFYIAALNSQGYDIKGVIWNVIRTPSIRQKKTETQSEYDERLRADIQADPSRYYERHLIKRWPEDIAESMRDMWNMNQHINTCLSARFPRNCYSCYMFNSQCEYLQLCAHHMYDEDLSQIEGFIQKTKRHEELEDF